MHRSVEPATVVFAREELRSGQKPPPGLFEVPIRLARVFRKCGEHYKAQGMYEWIRARHNSLAAKIGLAAVHEDKRRHSMAHRLYEEAFEAYQKALERVENSGDDEKPKPRLVSAGRARS